MRVRLRLDLVEQADAFHEAQSAAIEAVGVGLAPVLWLGLELGLGLGSGLELGLELGLGALLQSCGAPVLWCRIGTQCPPSGKLPCASGTYSTQEAGTRTPYGTATAWLRHHLSAHSSGRPPPRRT